MKKWILLYCFSFLAQSVSVLAQAPNPNHKLYNLKHGLAQMKTHCLLEDSIGNIWVGTRNGLSKFNGESFTNFYTTDGLAGNRIYDMYINEKGDIMIMTNGGLTAYDGAAFKTIIEQEHHTVDGFIVAVDSLGFYFHSNSLYYYSLVDSTSEEVIDWPFSWATNDDIEELTQIHENINFDKLSDNPKLVLHENFINSTNNLLHKSSSNSNTYYFKNVDVAERRITENIPEYWSLESLVIPAGVHYVAWNRIQGIKQNGRHFDFQVANQFKTLIESGSGRILIGTDFGLYIVPPNWFRDFDNTKLPYAWSVIESDEGDIYTNSWDNGIHKIDEKLETSKIDIASNIDSFRVSQFTNRPETYQRFLTKSAKDKVGKLFFPFYQGIIELNRGGFKLHDNQISHFSLLYDSHRDQIVGTNQGQISFLKNNNTSHTDFRPYGLGELDYFNSISQDKYHRYWMNNYTQLFCYDPESKKCIDYGKEYNDLVNEGSFGMHQEDSLLWIGLNEGMAKINVSTMEFEKINSVVLTSMVKDIIEYNDSLLLIGANNGLYLFNKNRFLQKDEVDIWFINESHGYTGIEPGFDCFYRDSKDNIWITSASHLTLMEPDSELLDRPPLNPNIVKINEAPIHFDHKKRTYPIDKGVNDIVIQFEACGLVRPNKVHYKYQLNNGKVSPWIKDTKLYLDDLSHGDYTLKLWAGPSDLDLKYLTKDWVQFSVFLPIWERAWFQWILGFIVLATLLYYGINYYLLRRRQIQYAQNLKENQYLKNQILLTELNPHFIFNALSSIQSNILKEDKMKASNQVVRLSKLIRSFLNSNYGGNMNNDQQTTVLLSEELKLLNYYLSFEKEKLGNKFEYNITYSDALDIEDIHIPPMIIQPIVENSIKHGILLLEERPGRLDITIDFEAEELTITIKDNGIGIEAANKHNESRFGKGASLGTKIIQERIDVLKQLGHEIDLTIQSSDQGTEVKLKLQHE